MMASAQFQRTNRVHNLDTRMKLLLVIMISTATLFAPSQEIVAWNYLVIISLWLLSGEVKRAGKFAVLFTIVLIIERASVLIPGDTVRMMVSFLLFIVARSMSMLIMCLWMANGLRIDDLITSLQNMHIPRGFTITIAVVFRYIPTIKGEFRNISNTMKMRGIHFNARNLLLHPARTTEYALIPLVMRSIKVADDLSAAAMTRGLDLENQRTSYREVRLHLADVVVSVFFVLLIVTGRLLVSVLPEGGIL